MWLSGLGHSFEGATASGSYHDVFFLVPGDFDFSENDFGHGCDNCVYCSFVGSVNPRVLYHGLSAAVARLVIDDYNGFEVFLSSPTLQCGKQQF